MEKQLEELKAAGGRAESACPQCGRRFGTAQGLRMHVIRKHEGREWGSRQKKHRTRRYGVAQPVAVRPAELQNGAHHHQPMQIPNFCPMCGFALRAIILAMNFQKEGA